MQCNGSEAAQQMPITHKPASLPHMIYQAKAADECLTSIRRVVIAWQMKSDTPVPPPHTHNKTESLKTRQKQSNPSIAYLDPLLCVMNHSMEGIATYLHEENKNIDMIHQ